MYNTATNYAEMRKVKESMQYLEKTWELEPDNGYFKRTYKKLEDESELSIQLMISK